jgi:hypothetical protein
LRLLLNGFPEGKETIDIDKSDTLAIAAAQKSSEIL